MPPPSKLTVAAAQVESALGDLDANLRKHLDVVDAARARGVDVLLFPEISLVGHSAGGDAPRLAIDRHDDRIRRLADASGPMCTTFGLIEEAPAAQFHNTAAVVRSGRLIFLHRKINIPTYGLLEEGKHYASGRYVETFELSGAWRAGVLICADAWNPALAHLAAVRGATLLLVPISSAVEAVGADFDNPAGWDTALRFYAMVYGLPVVMANRVGREGELSFWGGSRILDPFGRTLAQARDGGGEELVVAEVDYEFVRRARWLLPTVRDSNLDLILRETQRLAGTTGIPDIVRSA
jgi:predicted amidohydrolase